MKDVDFDDVDFDDFDGDGAEFDDVGVNIFRCEESDFKLKADHPVKKV